jgi:serine protease Do
MNDESSPSPVNPVPGAPVEPTWSASDLTPGPPPEPTEPQPQAERESLAQPQPLPESQSVTAAPVAGGARRGWVGYLLAGLAGGLVAGLVAGGIVAATDNNGGGGTTPIVQDSGRPAQVVAQPGDIHSIIDAVEPAVVRIDDTARTTSPFFGAQESQATGTGFLVASDGTIVTNNHVIRGGSNIEVTLSDGTKKPARVLGTDPTHDLAVLKIAGSGFPTVKLGRSSDLQVGDSVVAIGHALALPGGPTVTTGVVSALDRQISELGIPDAIQTDAAINFGNSGGPLVNGNGDVVGINTAIAGQTAQGPAQGIGWAISIDSAKPIIEQLRKTGEVRLAFLGVETADVNAANVRSRNLKVQSGALVTNVSAGTPADRAGIRRDDVIVRVGDRRITGSADVRNVIRSYAPGDRATVVVNRDGTERSFTVTLATLPANNL